MAKGKFNGGGYGGGNMNSMIKQAQKLQQSIAETQEENEKKTVSASVGGGAVCAVMNGKKELVSIKIKPEVLDPSDVEMLEDLILSAVNDCVAKADELVNNSMSKLTGGMNIPGLF